MAERAFIVVRAPNGDVREVKVGEVAIVIGRDESADVRVDDRRVSRRHASFRVSGGALWVADLGSINGVRKNGQRIDVRAVVEVGDTIRVGGYEVTLKDKITVQNSEPEISRPPVSSGKSAKYREKEDELSEPGSGVEETAKRPIHADVLPDDEPIVLLRGLDEPMVGQEFELEFELEKLFHDTLGDP